MLEAIAYIVMGQMLSVSCEVFVIHLGAVFDKVKQKSLRITDLVRVGAMILFEVCRLLTRIVLPQSVTFCDLSHHSVIGRL